MGSTHVRHTEPPSHGEQDTGAPTAPTSAPLRPPANATPAEIREWQRACAQWRIKQAKVAPMQRKDIDE